MRGHLRTPRAIAASNTTVTTTETAPTVKAAHDFLRIQVRRDFRRRNSQDTICTDCRDLGGLSLRTLTTFLHALQAVRETEFLPGNDALILAPLAELGRYRPSGALRIE
jgi:hypothetical protein